MTAPNTLLRLDRLTLRNFRCYGDCSLVLDQKLTMLVAENGNGKTATLDAIALALDVFVERIAHNRQSLGIVRSDVHQAVSAGAGMGVMLPAEFSAEGLVGGVSVRWARSITRLGEQRARNTTKDTKAISANARQLRERVDTLGVDGADRTLPLVAYYGTGRLWSELRMTEERRAVGHPADGRYAAYMDWLSASSSIRTFVAWYEETAGKAHSAVSKAYGPDERPHEHLAAVREAVHTVLEPTGWTSIDWPFPPPSSDGAPRGSGPLVADHPVHGRIPVSFLSDGIRTMIGLVGDLAYRCVRLNPHLGELAARQTPGIVLIDEVDMHLHPRWQQRVVDLLREAFPCMQMVLSTHSPHVLSTVDKNCIRAIHIEDGHGTFKTPELQTRGVESADVLAAIMGVSPVPQIDEAKWLCDYRALIDTGTHDTPDGQALRSNLIRHFGERHPVILDCDRLIRFQAFKRRQSQSEKG